MKCKSCGAEIKFIRSPVGNWMPVNAAPVKVIPVSAHGKSYVTEDGNVIKAVPAEDNPLFGQEDVVTAYVSHFATCPASARYRKDKNNRSEV